MTEPSKVTHQLSGARRACGSAPAREQPAPRDATVTGHTVLIGIGHPFRRDDGVGPAVVDLLRHRLTSIRLVTCDGEPTTLIDAWTGADRAIVIDAVRAAGGPAGQIHRFDTQHPTATRTGITMPHATDLGDAIALARVLDRMPQSLLIYGVQVEDVHFGPGLSPAVHAAARHLADEIATLLADCALPPC
jgi:hydrogenase maturation protease